MRVTLMRVSVVVGVVVLLAASSSTGMAAAGFRSLIGKRVPGTSAAWLAIASPEAHPVDVAGTSSPPLVTNDDALAQAVYFLGFANSKDAADFYVSPTVKVELVSNGVEGFEAVSGAPHVTAPARWLDLRECLWSGGPGEGGSRGAGTPSGGEMDAAGKCSSGTPSSIGFAIIMRRGSTVAIAQCGGGGNILGSAGVQAAIDVKVVTQTTALASHTSELLTSVGLS
jgi:hypothetical protein